MTAATKSLAQLVLLVVGAFVAFILLQHLARDGETWLATWLTAHLTGGSVDSTGSLIYVRPAHHRAFSALVSPSCSSLASVLALGCLAAVTPHPSVPRRLAAVGLAIAVVVAGNLVRIAASISIGLAAGSSSLVLFHDWVGSMFGFAYTVGGYLLMLWALLPASASHRTGEAYALA
jgi:carbamoyl-phosphate synthase large subunit